MITCARAFNVFVSDQQRATEFYVDKLGFEKRVDEPMGPDARWIEVAPHGAQSVLVLFTPPGMESRIGTRTGVILECDDLQATYEELRGRGVDFDAEPSRNSWGLWTELRDLDGNVFGLHQYVNR